MNEAGEDWGASSLGSRVAWFQIGIPPARRDDPVVLPAFAALTVGAECVRCIGTLELGAVQMLIPLQLSVKDQNISVGEAWFQEHDPALRTRVRVELHTGDDSLFGDGRLENVLLGMRFGSSGLSFTGDVVS